MFLDGLILVMAVVLMVNGWSRGLLASWRGLVAIVLATLVARFFYIDFSTWITSRLLIEPKIAVVLGYVAIWFSLEVVFEMVLSIVIRGGVSERPKIVDRVGGVLYGLFKALVIVLLPLMALSIDLKIPEPPKGHAAFSVPAALSDGVYLVPGIKLVAQAMVPLLGNFVVSNNPPSFTPVYGQPKTKDNNQSDNSSNLQIKGNKDLEELLKE